MTLEFFPKDTVILSAGHPASESLYVVHKGGVKLALAKFYSLDVDNSHHALADAFLAARVWQKMIYTLRARGIDRLHKLLRVSGA